MKGKVVLRYVGNRAEPEPEAPPEFLFVPPLPIGVYLFLDELNKLAEAATSVDPQFARYLRK